MSTLTPQEKGNRLENAVCAIESAIFESSPSLKESAYDIESKKIINAHGVRHEIDIFITVRVARGYDTVFIFECKNWQESVGKNELIVFSEKIDAAGAQRGFFVARSFTRDAEAQAQRDPRITLLHFDERHPEGSPSLMSFAMVSENSIHARLNFKRRRSDLGKPTAIEGASATIVFRGTAIQYDQYCREWIDEVHRDTLSQVPSDSLPNGDYEHQVVWKRTLEPGDLAVNGLEIESCELNLTVKYTIYRPVIHSDFEVTTRGRSISFVPHFVGGMAVSRLTVT